MDLSRWMNLSFTPRTTVVVPICSFTFSVTIWPRLLCWKVFLSLSVFLTASSTTEGESPSPNVTAKYFAFGSIFYPVTTSNEENPIKMKWCEFESSQNEKASWKVCSIPLSKPVIHVRNCTDFVCLLHRSRSKGASRGMGFPFNGMQSEVHRALVVVGFFSQVVEHTGQETIANDNCSYWPKCKDHKQRSEKR